MEELDITWVVEKTDSWDKKLPLIEMMMATTLAQKQGTVEIDMKVEKETCETDEEIKKCGLWTVPHYHLMGSVR